jgi:uncharacterized DUF497 family protein
MRISIATPLWQGHEDRLLVLGISVRARILFVVYVEVGEDDIVRIVSARR